MKRRSPFKEAKVLSARIHKFGILEQLGVCETLSALFANVLRHAFGSAAWVSIEDDLWMCLFWSALNVVFSVPGDSHQNVEINADDLSVRLSSKSTHPFAWISHKWHAGWIYSLCCIIVHPNWVTVDVFTADRRIMPLSVSDFGKSFGPHCHTAVQHSHNFIHDLKE